MKKNGPLLRDSITEEENAAALWPFFSFPLSVFPPGANLSGMLDIRAEMVLEQTQQDQRVGK